MKRSIIAAFLLITFCLPSSMTLAWQGSGQNDLLTDFLKRRAALTHGRLKVSSVYRNHIDDQRHRIRFDIWFSRDKLKSYWNNNNSSTVNCFGCYQGQNVYIVESVPSQTPAIAILGKERSSPSADRYLTPDARYLGVFAATFHETAMFRDQLQTVFSRQPDVPATVESVELDGVRCQKYSFVNTSDFRFTYWFTGDAEPAVVRVTCHEESNPDDIAILDIENQRLDGPLRWFPASLDFIHQVNGKPRYTETLIVEEVDFETEVSQTEFSIGGIRNVTVGQPVAWKCRLPRPCEVGLLFWDGEKVACKATATSATPRRSAGKIIALNVGFLCILGAIVYFFRSAKNRSGNR